MTTYENAMKYNDSVFESRIAPHNVEELKDNITVSVNKDKHTVTVRSFIIVVSRENLVTSNCDAMISPFERIEFAGVARLKEGDTNSQVYAERVARSKMERQYNRWIRREIKEAMKYHAKRQAALGLRLVKIENTIKTITSHIVKITSDKITSE